MLEIRIIFYYKDRPAYDPDWDRKHLVLPNVGDEVFLRNTNENEYEKYWYVVKKRRWINDHIVRIYLDDERWNPTN